LKLSFGKATSFLSFIKKTDTYVKQLAKPVLVVQGLNDHLVSPRAVAKLFKDIPSDNKTFLIVGKAEHLVLEEGRFSPALSAKLIDWMKTVGASMSNIGRANSIAVATLACSICFHQFFTQFSPNAFILKRTADIKHATRASLFSFLCKGKPLQG
jgi:hypothetical protein